MIKINKSPVPTSQNFGVNYFDFDDTLLNQNMRKEVALKYNDTLSQVNILEISKSEFPNNNIFTEMSNQLQKPNCAKKIVFDKMSQNAHIVEFDSAQSALVDNLILLFKNNVNAKVIVKHNSKEILYHNSTIKIIVEDGATANVALVSTSNVASASLFSVEADVMNSASLNLQLFDFSNNNIVHNVKVNTHGDCSNIDLISMYFGQNKDRLSLNYMFDLQGKNCNANMNVYGVLNGESEKNFVGTINFQKGSLKSVGEENEFCMLLSKNVKAKSTPILLSAEEDVDGKHATSVGYLDPKEMFYANSRGLSKKDAIKLFVKAKFDVMLRKIFDLDLKKEIEQQIDGRLDNE